MTAILYQDTQFFDNNGNPAVIHIWTYATGTSTLLATYTDATGSVNAANPVVTDASGRVKIWMGLTTNYKFVIMDSTDTITYDTIDPAGSNIAGIVSNPVTVLQGGSGATTKTVGFNNLSPITTKGDIITSDGTNNVRLGIGSTNNALTVVGGVPAWSAPIVSITGATSASQSGSDVFDSTNSTSTNLHFNEITAADASIVVAGGGSNAAVTITAGTVPVTKGGSGVATLTTAYGTLCAGTTATGSVQTVSPGTSGNVLTSGGASALPTYSPPPLLPLTLSYNGGTGPFNHAMSNTFPGLVPPIFASYSIVTGTLFLLPVLVTATPQFGRFCLTIHTGSAHNLVIGLYTMSYAGPTLIANTSSGAMTTSGSGLNFSNVLSGLSSLSPGVYFIGITSDATVVLSGMTMSPGMLSLSAFNVSALGATNPNLADNTYATSNMLLTSTFAYSTTLPSSPTVAGYTTFSNGVTIPTVSII